MKGLNLLGGSLALLLLIGGCTSIGPGTVSRDRLDYSSAVGDSWKSQMLLNLVKIRYGDAPVFLSSIMFLFTFVETGSKEAAPILTIPTTR